MNAANAVPNAATWILCLNAPYDDGGYENSSRVLGDAGFDMQPPLVAASWSDGALNNPLRPSTRWTAEIRFPLAQLATNTTAAVPPRDGDIWRINFSRVEWGVLVADGRYIKQPSCITCPRPGSSAEDNWVWSPQGVIAMHRRARVARSHPEPHSSPARVAGRRAGVCSISLRLTPLRPPLLLETSNGPCDRWPWSSTTLRLFNIACFAGLYCVTILLRVTLTCSMRFFRLAVVSQMKSLRCASGSARRRRCSLDYPMLRQCRDCLCRGPSADARCSCCRSSRTPAC
jgi:hypothetical protein